MTDPGQKGPDRDTTVIIMTKCRVILLRTLGVT